MTQDSFRKIENPYIVGNPIKSKELFFGRQDEFSFIKEKIAGKKGIKVILLKGGRRSGKTSILKQIEEGHIPEIREAAEAVFCDFHQMTPQIEKDEDVPFQIGNAILAVSTFHDFRDSFMNGNGSWTTRLSRLIRACLKKISPKVLILLWDEYEALEEPLRSGKISASAAFGWFNDVRDEMVYSIMTGSREFGDRLSPIFSHNSQILDINLLTENAAKDLIRKPVEGFLEYSKEAVQRIYRLSGGYSFFVQYICQSLVSHINSETHRNHAEAADLDDVVEFIIRNPAGHIQETWRSLPDQAKLTLTALAHTIRESDAYTEQAEVIRTAGKLRLPIGEKEYNEAISGIKDKYLIKRQDDGKVRFRIDIFRYWIAYHFQTLEDLGLKNDYPPYPEEKKPPYRKILLYSGLAPLAAVIIVAGYISGYVFSLVKPLLSPPPKVEQIKIESQGKEITNALSMKFVYIESGTFMMGSPGDEQKLCPYDKDDKKNPEQNPHQVTVKGFYMQTTEVTQGQWKKVMVNNPSNFKDCGDNCPVEMVSWDDAQKFIMKLNEKEGTDKYRLPTEEEWEYAARAGTTTPFAFGKCLSTNYENYDGRKPLPSLECKDKKGEYRRETIPVGSLNHPNSWGLHDMHGNVREWCENKYDNTEYRVNRGGHWNSEACICRSANRNMYSPDKRFQTVGFRLAMTSNEPPLKRGDYTQLTVIIEPEAIRNSAKWRVNNGNWHKSGETVSKLPTGTHTIELGTVDGWKTPPFKSVNIEKIKDVHIEVEYQEDSLFKKGDCVQLKPGIEKPEGFAGTDIEFIKKYKFKVDVVVDKNELVITLMPKIEQKSVRASQWQKCR